MSESSPLSGGPARPALRHPSRRALLRGSSGAALALAAGAALSACGSSSGGGQGGDAATGKVTVWSWTTAATALRSVVPAFEKAHPDITVDVVDVGNPAIWDKITVGLASGGQGLADVLHIGCDYLPGYLEKFPGGLADLSALGADRYKGAFASGLWPVVSGKNGHVYAMPWEVNPLGFYYRKDLFDRAGIDPTAYRTWDDVIASAGRFRHANPGCYLIGIDKSATTAPDCDFLQSLMQLQGAFYFDLQGRVTLGSPQAVKALTVIKELNDAGLVGDASGDHGWSNLVKADKVAVSPLPAWAAHYLETEFPKQKGQWRLTRPPAVTPGGKRAAIVNSTHLAVAASSKRRRAAFAFVEFALTRPDSMNRMFRAGGVFPALTAAYSDPMYAQPDPYYGGQPVLRTFTGLLGEGADATNYSGDYARALKLASDAQVKMFLKGGDPATVLHSAAQQLAQQSGRRIA
ncbi:ABC transporter substrate-binding protein [Streptomyces sp. NBC_00448]|uniref:ABC transporter substrate-binding protein n=1 Tax=Streptomyces sp. NBC_00448 TaxID=2903652 RepID=UPI002E1AEE0C